MNAKSSGFGSQRPMFNPPSQTYSGKPLELDQKRGWQSGAGFALNRRNIGTVNDAVSQSERRPKQNFIVQKTLRLLGDDVRLPDLA
jgi:hypothetical protein